MTRDRLDRLRAVTTAFRDAVRRDEMLMEAGRRARLDRDSAARELADALRSAEIPEGQGFEHGGLVAWIEAEPGRRPGRETLGHVFLAFYREAR